MALIKEAVHHNLCGTCGHRWFSVDREACPSCACGWSSLPEDDKQRLDFPMFDGLLAYFPNALAEVARVSFLGNEQHNPGQPMHWARGKSTDHENKIIRHLVDAGKLDSRGVRHSARVAWRALALLQEELERDEGFPMSRGSKAPVKEVFDRPINMSDQEN